VSEYLEKLKSLQFSPKQTRDQARSVQFPKNYPYAKQHAPDGTVIWGTKQEARDIASRGRDNGEDIHFDG
jgi:hypothetical protein